MKTIIKKLKQIFETFTVFNLGWDIKYGFSLILLETMLDNPKSNNISNLIVLRSLFRLDINIKRINYSILYSKLKTIKL